MPDQARRCAAGRTMPSVVGCRRVWPVASCRARFHPSALSGIAVDREDPAAIQIQHIFVAELAIEVRNAGNRLN